ncbi:MAG: DUF5666 domain-containing protein [Thiohalomonadales bacterium]
MEIRYLAIVALVGTITIAGCSSDSGSNGSTKYSGTISNINPGQSLTLNTGKGALAFNTAGAQIVNDGENSLSNGKVVTIQGTHDGSSGQADTITYDSEIEGFVISNTIAADDTGSMNVMGQTVVVDSTTVYGDDLTHASDIIVDTQNLPSVEVSGIFQSDGTILAKYMERKSDTNEIEIKGFATNVVISGDTATFNIAACNIIVDANTKLDDMNSIADLTEGAKVEVESTRAKFVGSNDTCTVTAQKLELEDENENEDDDGADDDNGNS